MKFSYNWLQEYFEEKLPTPDNLAIKVGLHSFELEEVEKININNHDDILIDWDILPNRSSDCLCYIGIAKEISTVCELKFNNNINDFNGDKTFKTSDFLSLNIEDVKKVPRALKRLAINVKVSDSPKWLKNRLESIGQKSINNVVDITNYVMWVTGQPVHAFDYDKMSGDKDFKKLFIRRAVDGEEVIDLSGDTHVLSDDILVTADSEKALDIGGVKGGLNSGVTDDTTRVVLAAVNFEYRYVRNATKKLKLRTDGSKLYENEVPFNKADLAMTLMSSLLSEIANASIADEIIDTKPELKKIEKRKISCSAEKIKSLLGMKISNGEISTILSRLYLFEDGQKIENDSFDVIVPEERLDLRIWQDVAEEIARVYGYENIKGIFPEEGFKLPKDDEVKISSRKINDILVENGFYEVYNRSIVRNGVVELANSLNSKATTLRTNLIEKLKDRAGKNLINDGEPKLFEIGKVFKGIKPTKKDFSVDEYFSFAGIIGKRKIKEKQKEDLFYRTKGYLETIFDNLRVKNIKWEESRDNDNVADIVVGDSVVGRVGINFWEINLEKLVENIDNKISYKKVSKYPKMDRDVAFWVDVDFKVLDAQKIIKEKLPKDAIGLELFDIYKDKEKNKKSFAFRIIFQSDEKTLSDDYVNGIMDGVYKTLTEKGFEIR